jgi:exodeoxyribonuclease VII small subunit
MSEPARKTAEPSFEEAMGALEAIVQSLETERLPLEEMVSAYERGVNLLRTCRSRIEAARQRVELITADLEGRAPATLTEFAATEVTESAATEPAKKSKRKMPSATNEPPDGDIRLF